MREYQSHYAGLLQSFVRYREISEKWNPHEDALTASFDKFCVKYQAHFTLQELAETWCQKRNTESGNSWSNRVCMINGFFRYLNTHGLASCVLLDMPKYERTAYVPHAFTQEELTLFFDACDSLSRSAKTLSQRVEALVIPIIFRLLYSSGLRTCEARLLEVDDVDLREGILNVRHSKGPHQHYVILHDSMLDVMRRYDAAMQKIYTQRKYFFPKGQSSPYTAPLLSMQFRKLWDGVSNNYARAYDLRHHYAITNINKWTDAGYDFFDKFTYLSKSMGHSSLESTSYYYSLVPSLAGVLCEKSEAGFNDMIPEVEDNV